MYDILLAVALFGAFYVLTKYVFPRFGMSG